MRIEPARGSCAPPRVPLGPGGHLKRALLQLAGGQATVDRHREKAWASITFEGVRHTIDLSFEGATAVACGEELIAALPDHEFAIPGHLVADATVTGADHVTLPTPRLSVTCDLLLLREV